MNSSMANVKHLPGCPLSDSMLSVVDLIEVTESSDFLVWVIVHQFLKHALDQTDGHLKFGSVAISLKRGRSESLHYHWHNLP
jgi:glycerol-3-phosphate dehydrogenase